jgi:multicomponent K+:H+ antiporter subunit E
MSRFLPFPLAALGLLAFWLMLNQTLSLGHVLLGLVVALVGSRTLRTLQVPQGGPRRLAPALRLTALVVADVVRSNLAVARIVLQPRRGMTSGFVRIPLTLRNPHALAALACIITATPGTLWVAYDAVRGVLTIHVLDLVEEQQWIGTIKGRYESRLLEIFP